MGSRSFLLLLSLMAASAAVVVNAGCECNPSINRPVCCNGVTFPNRVCAKCSGRVANVYTCTDGACSGTGTLRTGCTCSNVRDPVCGSDGATYQNKCLAECRNVFSYTKGPCPITSSSSSSSQAHKCKRPGQRCEGIYNPVCAHSREFPDGKMYWNRCNAVCDGVNTGLKPAEPGTNGGGDMQCSKLRCGCPLTATEPVCCRMFDGPTKSFPNICLAKCNGYPIKVSNGLCPGATTTSAVNAALNGRPTRRYF